MSKKLYKQALQTEIINLEKLKSTGIQRDYFRYRFRINQLLSNLTRELTKGKVNFKFEKNNLLYLYADFFSNMVGYLNQMEVGKFTYNSSYKGKELMDSVILNFDPEIFNRVCDDDGSETKSITLCDYYILKSNIDESDNESIFKALELYYKFFPLLTLRLQYNYFTLLLNILIRLYRLDRIYAVKENELLDFNLNKGIFGSDKNPGISHIIFANTLFVKLYLLTSDEVRKFIDTYIEKVVPEFRADIKNYAMAHLCFKEKQFGKCLEYASKKNSLKLGFVINRFKLMICSLFEGGMYEEALYNANALEHYLSRTKSIGPVIRQETTNFIKAFRYLTKFHSKGTQDFEVKFAKFFETSKYTLWGEWFAEKISQQYKANEFKGTPQLASNAH